MFENAGRLCRELHGLVAHCLRGKEVDGDGWLRIYMADKVRFAALELFFGAVMEFVHAWLCEQQLYQPAAHDDLRLYACVTGAGINRKRLAYFIPHALFMECPLAALLLYGLLRYCFFVRVISPE